MLDLKKRRMELGLTQEQVGDACGVSKTAVMKWENGQTKNMRRDRLVKLASVLQISILDIVDTDDALDIISAEEKPTATGEQFDQQLVSMLIELNDGQVQRVRDFVSGMLSTGKD